MLQVFEINNEFKKLVTEFKKFGWSKIMLFQELGREGRSQRPDSYSTVLANCMIIRPEQHSRIVHNVFILWTISDDAKF